MHPSSVIQSAESLSLLEPSTELSQDIAHFVQEGIDLESAAEEPKIDEFWRGLRQVGTELWLDSGDIDSIESLWNREFAGLTTNNTLLNKEVQKEVYDELIPRADKLLSSLDANLRVREIAFILNLRHALRLVEKFRCRVSIELHTDLAYDTEATVAYAKRCHEVCPDFFVVKVPLTPHGLIAIRELRDDDIEVNCTLGFSARQNYVATALANPSFVNVFLGRLNSFVADNGLGDGNLIGEKTTIASQHEVSIFSRGLPQSNTRQIAASLRDAAQLPLLAGVDVITMPTKVAEQAGQQLSEPWRSRLNEEYDVSLAQQAGFDSAHVEKLWLVSKQERKLVQDLILSPADSAEGLIRAAGDGGARDLFPQMSSEELQQVSNDGKIPTLDRWLPRIESGDLAIDSLMTLAGLASFAQSQAQLDQRIQDLIHT